MLFWLADFRAKRTLLQERGLLGLSRYTVMDALQIQHLVYQRPFQGAR